MIEVNWLDVRTVRALHLELVAEHGGIAGVRDEGLLESAPARPKKLLVYGEPSLGQLAASIAFGLAKHHCFLDGNKRIALAALSVFLDINDYELVAPEEEAVAIILRLASSDLTEKQLTAWIEEHLQPLDPAK